MRKFPVLAGAGLRRHPLALALVIGLAAALGAGAGTSGAASHTAAAGVTGLVPASTAVLTGVHKTLAAACHHERGPFHTRGNIVNGSTGRYIPYGINVTGLAHTNYADLIAQDKADIAATANDWCANTVRFQVRQANLVSATGHVHQAFLAAVTTEVRYAEARGLIVVLNLQWQLDPAALEESMPTQRSKAFWGSLAYHFGSDPNVIFDIYNEPEQWVHCGWAFWHNGGECDGREYIGMQTLADYVRARASNLFWIEGISAGSSLNEAWRYRISSDGPLEYSEHRPLAPHEYSTWDSEFGYISNSGHAPVVEGEWADYARSDAPWACWNNAPVSAPRFLRYLQARNFGLIVTELKEDQLIQSTNLDDPTHIRSNWSCTDGLDQGVGHQAQQWFIRQNT
ncbi:MAG TPA: cellulase family glycosylhydrolase [Streptosporangiaceae bacterium]|jgi:hypothetical protein